MFYRQFTRPFVSCECRLLRTIALDNTAKNTKTMQSPTNFYLCNVNQKENGRISNTDAGLQEKTDADVHEKKWYPGHTSAFLYVQLVQSAKPGIHPRNESLSIHSKAF
jgi:hypothetical protein